ncbi:alpha/beta hydrolase [Micromonospora sp. NPDC000207]|uniref:alpha/beta hydrolase family protein n=1 Tax=Micromonospora sp. NPDC000207 TaxID=3154246 RepID=UPI00331DD180
MTADRRAVLTRPSPPPDATVRYGDHPDQIADLRRPAGPTSTGPLVVVVHGGFWRAEYDRTHTGPLAAALAESGHPVAQVEYRRTGRPGGGWPATGSDVVDAVAALPELVADAFPELNVSGQPLLVGHSAGGHLALHVAGVAPQTVDGVLALAPVTDLAEAYRLDLDQGAVAALLGGGPAEFPDRYAAADPATRPPPPVRTVILHGTDDRQVPITMSRAYAAAAAEAGADVTLVEVPRCDHFGLIDPMAPDWPQVTSGLRSLHND